MLDYSKINSLGGMQFNWKESRNSFHRVTYLGTRKNLIMPTLACAQKWERDREAGAIRSPMPSLGVQEAVAVPMTLKNDIGKKLLSLSSRHLG